jgi:hypothetical protein
VKQMHDSTFGGIDSVYVIEEKLLARF